MLFGLTPTVGLQTGLVVVFALVTRRLFYFNRAAALALIYISNPLTVAPIYYGLYWVGCWFVPGDATLEQFRQILTFQGFSGWWLSLTKLATDVGLPLAVGTLVVAPIGAVATYPLTRFLLQWYRGGDAPDDEQKMADQEGLKPAHLGAETAAEAVEPAHSSILRPQPMSSTGHPATCGKCSVD